MFINLSLLIIGFLLLYLGARWLVKGASDTAIMLSIKPFIIAIVVVALATSLPEGIVSIVAAIKKYGDISLGNIIGSNIANIGLAMAASAIVNPLKIKERIIRREVLILILVSSIFYFFCIDLRLSRFEGVCFLILLVLFFYYSLRQASSAKFAGDYKPRGPLSIFFLIVGIALLLSGAELIIRSSVFIAREVGISEFVIAASMIAVGTSLPEVATSLVSSYYKRYDICLGNIIGSNIFNILFVGGLVIVYNPLNIGKGLISFELPIMLILSLLLLPIMITGHVISRLEGFFLFFIYSIFILFLFFS